MVIVIYKLQLSSNNTIKIFSKYGLSNLHHNVEEKSFQGGQRV